MIDYAIIKYEEVFDSLLNNNCTINKRDFHSIWYSLTNKVEFVKSDGIAKSFLKDSNIEVFRMIQYVYGNILNHYTDVHFNINAKDIVNNFFYIQIDLIIYKDNYCSNLTNFNLHTIRNVINKLSKYKTK